MLGTRTSPPLPTRTAIVGRYAAAAAAIAVATIAGKGVHHLLRTTHTTAGDDLTNVAMVYLLAVVFVAARLGLGPAVAASALGVGAFDFLFVPPFYTFAVQDTQYLATFAVILVVGGLTSALTNQVRRQAELAKGRERRTAALLDLSRQLAGARDVATIIGVTAAQVTDATAAVLLPGDGGRLALATAGPFPLDAVERRAAEWAFAHGRAAGAGAVTTLLDPETVPTAAALYLPMVNGRGTAGVLGVRPVDADHVPLLEGFAAQAAAALERAALADEARAAWERVEAEFLRNTLLSSVSHDLRTPLAAIAGAAEALLQPEGLDPADRRDLTETVLDESRRMERLITNLLDVTRLESGGLHLRREWQPIGELVGAALHRMRHRLGNRPVTVDLPPQLPMAHLDAVSFEQVLANLLDNAAEHTPADSPVEITARAADGRMVLTVADRGHGVPPGTEEQVFRKFFRAYPNAKGGRHGIGLGLAICRGIVEAHGGRITVANRDGGGAAFGIDLPLVDGAPAVLPPTAV
jgi:two-component system sensor histidine kinase KdpD